MCLMCSRSRTSSPTVPPCNVWRSHSLIILPEQCSIALFVPFFRFFALSISFHALCSIICRPNILGNCCKSRNSLSVKHFVFYFSVTLSFLNGGVKVKTILWLLCNEEGNRRLFFPFAHLRLTFWLIGSEDRFMLHLIWLGRFVLQNTCARPTHTHTHTHTHTSSSHLHLQIVNITDVFAPLPFSAHRGVMNYDGLYGHHLLLTGHIHLPFIESTREVHINIHSHCTVNSAVSSYAVAIF